MESAKPRKSLPERVRVVRVLEIEGTPGWVQMTLANSVVGPDKPYATHKGVIRELGRTESHYVR
jgi:hypothetical protein